MSNLVVIGYDDPFKAEEVRVMLWKLQKEYLIDLEDAVVAVKEDSGKVKLHQAVNLTAAGAMGGGFWGALIGLIFLNPLLGLAVGAAAGAASGALADVGIDDAFMKELAQTMHPGSSVLFHSGPTSNPGQGAGGTQRHRRQGFSRPPFHTTTRRSSRKRSALPNNETASPRMLAEAQCGNEIIPRALQRRDTEEQSTTGPHVPRCIDRFVRRTSLLRPGRSAAGCPPPGRNRYPAKILPRHSPWSQMLRTAT